MLKVSSKVTTLDPKCEGISNRPGNISLHLEVNLFN